MDSDFKSLSLGCGFQIADSGIESQCFTGNQDAQKMHVAAGSAVFIEKMNGYSECPTGIVAPTCSQGMVNLYFRQDRERFRIR